MESQSQVKGEETEMEVSKSQLREEVQGMKFKRKRNQKKCSICVIVAVILSFVFLVIVAVSVVWLSQKQLHEELRSQIESLESQVKQLKSEAGVRDTKVLNISNQQMKIQEQLKVLDQQQKLNNINIGNKSSVSTNLKPLKGNEDKYQINEITPQKGGIQAQQEGTVQGITFLSKNNLNQTIQQFLYEIPQLIKARQVIHSERKTFLKRFSYFVSIQQANFNMKFSDSDQVDQQEKMRMEYQRVEKFYKLSEVRRELPMCIIVPSYNNKAQFRLQYNLNSVFTQNYSNYFLVLTNDASTDHSDQLYRKYFQFYRIPSSKYIYINNTHHRGAMENDYIANHQYCSSDAISVHLDGDDQLLGRNVLKILNAEYQRRKAGAIYSNFYFYRHNSWTNKGFTSQYAQSIKTSNSYRIYPMAYSHLKSYRTELFRKIDKSNFMNQRGKFFEFTSDVAFYLPVMELSCGRVHKIQGFHYLYHTGTGLNDETISRPKQRAAEIYIRAKPKLSCDEQFKKKMEGKP